MKKIARIGLAASVLFLLASGPPVFADSITITSGALDIKGAGLAGHAALFLQGTDGFSLHAFPDTSASTAGPSNCWASPCAPGTPIALAAMWSGGDLLGATATYRGVTYTGVGSAAAESSALVRFSGSALSPTFTGATTAFVEAPFTFGGSFHPGVGVPSATLTGQGTASLWLTLDRSFGDLSWAPTETRYDFAVTPEPSSLLLLGTGLVGALGMARRRLRLRVDRTSSR